VQLAVRATLQRVHHHHTDFRVKRQLFFPFALTHPFCYR
jgi:hypothetical protein